MTTNTMMRSVVVVRDPDCQKEDSLIGCAASGVGIDNYSCDGDDSLSCRTDQTTVRASNARRVTTSPAMDQTAEIADDVVQLIQRLFQGVEHDDREAVLATIHGYLRIRHMQPIHAVRALDSVWRILGIEHSEDLLHDLSNFNMNRRDEFINALIPVVEQMQHQDVINTAQDASATSSLTSAEGASNTASVCQSIAAESGVSPSSTEPQVAPRVNPLFIDNFQGNIQDGIQPVIARRDGEVDLNRHLGPGDDHVHNDDEERGSAVGLPSDTSSSIGGQSNPQI